jgi:2',3'-cyclic-nucleotide 2'-phosphodiesterase (5'-nucleotidase family)
MRTWALLSTALLIGLAIAGPENESFAPGQAIADEIRSFAGTSIAWIPGAMLQAEGKGDLRTYLRFGTDEISVVSLTGKQVQAALERSVNLYPSQNPSFLQVSGIEVSFSKSATPDNRIRTVLVDGKELDLNAKYEVAMPVTIARGGLGFFTVWEKTAIARTYEQTTLESLLKGKTGFVRTARWKMVD